MTDTTRLYNQHTSDNINFNKNCQFHYKISVFLLDPPRLL